MDFGMIRWHTISVITRLVILLWASGHLLHLPNHFDPQFSLLFGHYMGWRDMGGGTKNFFLITIILKSCNKFQITYPFKVSDYFLHQLSFVLNFAFDQRNH